MSKRNAVMALAGLVVLASGFVVGQSFSNPFNAVFVGDPSKLFQLSTQAVDNYQSNRPSARSAPQVSQLADETNTFQIYILTKQNEEIIRLLKKVAGETP